jgi:NAD(P)-dependent dehydrogenase (short-subunit alcohol dehydrogenase family)
MRDTAAEIRALGRRALVVKADVTVWADVEQVVGKAIQEFGRIDILVNTAATRAAMMAFHEMPLEEWDLHINAVYKGALHCCRAVIPHMIAQRFGRIIIITTASAKVPSPTLSAYAGTRAGVAHFSRSLAGELEPHGITVNCVVPGWTWSGVHVPMFTQDVLDMLVATQPIARFGQPQEIAAAVLFLASDQAGYITGVQLSVDGGLAPF